MIKLLILDVDGVLTDGKKYYDSTGLAKYKTFCDKDFSAIKKFKSAGVEVIFLSGDTNINESIAKNRSIDFYASRGVCKSAFINIFKSTYNILPDEMCYVGDDIFDLNIMKEVGYSFCPSDAVKTIREYCCGNILNRVGGDNCLDKLFDVCESRNVIPPFNEELFYNLDKDDKF